MRNESLSLCGGNGFSFLDEGKLSCFSFAGKVCKLIRKILKERLCILTRVGSRLNWCFIAKSVSGLTGTFGGDSELRCRDYEIYVLYLINFIVPDSFMISLGTFVEQ